MRKTVKHGSARLSIAGAGITLILAAPAAGQATFRVSVDSGEGQADKDCIAPAISADGRHVAFVAYADLTGGTALSMLGTTSDAYLRDRQNGTTERLSVHTSGAGGNDYSYSPTLSTDVRFVAFTSFATNLVDGDTNGPYPVGLDVFVRDRQSGTTVRVSVDSLGAQGNGESYGNSITADGRYVAFFSAASNLVAGDTNAAGDAFVHDRQTGTTERVSVGALGAQGNGESFTPSISADGRYVTFHSAASNLVPGDTNGKLDLFVRDRQSGTTERVSVGSGGAQGDGDSYSGRMSADGRYLAFGSLSTNLVAGDTNAVQDVFLRDRQSGTTERLSVDSSGAQGNGESMGPSISPDGRYVVFYGGASNLVAGDTNAKYDVFLRDRQSGTTERVSLDSNGAQATDNSNTGSITPDGRCVVFQSHAILVPEDTNVATDIYLRDRAATGFASLCEPGQDGVIACPCANPPAGAGGGCDNFGAGPVDSGTLTATGVAYLGSDSVVLHSTGANDTSLTVFWTGTTLISPPGVAHGAGVRCVSGLKRLYTGSASGGSISAPAMGDPSVSARSAAVGQPISAGDTRYYFSIYRDPNAAAACGDPAATINLTNAGAIIWNLD